MKKYRYSLSENNIDIYNSKSYFECLHEFLNIYYEKKLLIEHDKYTKDTMFIDDCFNLSIKTITVIENTNKKYNIVKAEHKMNLNLMLHEIISSNKTFNLNNDKEIYNLLETNCPNYMDHYYVIKNLLNKITNNSNGQEIKNNNFILNETEKYQNNVITSDNVCEIKLTKKETECNVCNDIFLNNNNDEDLDSNIENMNKDDLLKKMIELENIQLNINELINIEKECITEDKDTIANYMCKLKDEQKQKKLEEQRLLDRKHVYEHDKNFAYSKIYEDFFVKKKFNGFENLPPLFMMKFIVFLFMEGKNNNGEYIYENLFGRDDQFDIYEILIESLTDIDSIENIDNDEYKNILDKFLGQLPEIQLYSSEEITNSLNQNNDNSIFNETISDPIEEYYNEGDENISLY
jgi:hypothetical protein